MKVPEAVLEEFLAVREELPDDPQQALEAALEQLRGELDKAFEAQEPSPFVLSISPTRLVYECALGDCRAALSHVLGDKGAERKIFDSKDRELRIGDRVLTKMWGAGELTGFSTQSPNATGITVFVLLDSHEMRWRSLPAEEPDTYRCPDLELIDPQEEAVAPAVSERSSA